MCIRDSLHHSLPPFLPSLSRPPPRGSTPQHPPSAAWHRQARRARAAARLQARDQLVDSTTRRRAHSLLAAHH
eukprot:13387768-Alexandrium_andersonii.AAC.1